MTSDFTYGDASYKIVGDGMAVFCSLESYECDHFKVPSVVFSPSMKKYEIIGICDNNDLYNPKDFGPPCGVLYARYAKTISFDEDSKIEKIFLNFILFCSTNDFYLPPKIKRIANENSYGGSVKIHIKERNKFISILNEFSIMNHYPLELLRQNQYNHSRLIIRETVRIIGDASYASNKLIATVVIPSSVEDISDYAFFKCKSLRTVSFRRNSQLSNIGSCSFYKTHIKQISIPSNVQKIGIKSFYKCKALLSISFDKESRLKSIGERAFTKTKIKSVCFPSNLEEIGIKAFGSCKNLSTISFQKESKLTIIKEYAFFDTGIKSINIPSSVEVIGDYLFYWCEELESISFDKGSRLNVVGEGVFDETKIETFDIPIKHEAYK